MRRAIADLIVLLALMMIAGIRAEATTLAFTGSLSLQVDARFSPPVLIPGSGVASVGRDGAFHLLSFQLSGGEFGPFTGTASHTGASTGPVRFTNIANLGGSFTALSGGSPPAGVMGLSGMAKVCILFDATCNFIYIPIPLSATPASNVGFGIGGTSFAAASGINVTMQHNAWGLTAPALTIHNSFSAVTTTSGPVGFVHGPASLTSSTAQLSGTVQLVTASKALTSLGGLPDLPVVATLTIHFVPEPALLLLGSAAAVTIAMAARRRGSPPSS